MASEIPLRVKFVCENARVPSRQSASAAGYDLCSTMDWMIEPGSRACISTGIAISLPPGTYGRIASRSSLSKVNGVEVGAGVIDQDYRGELLVNLFNHGSSTFKVFKGDRIAQLIITPILTPPVVLVDDLDATTRGIGGFGSTGI